jgi:hypothetical protein
MNIDQRFQLSFLYGDLVLSNKHIEAPSYFRTRCVQTQRIFCGLRYSFLPRLSYVSAGSVVPAAIQVRGGSSA